MSIASNLAFVLLVTESAQDDDKASKTGRATVEARDEPQADDVKDVKDEAVDDDALHEELDIAEEHVDDQLSIPPEEEIEDDLNQDLENKSECTDDVKEEVKLNALDIESESADKESEIADNQSESVEKESESVDASDEKDVVLADESETSMLGVQASEESIEKLSTDVTKPDVNVDESVEKASEVDTKMTTTMGHKGRGCARGRGRGKWAKGSVPTRRAGRSTTAVWRERKESEESKAEEEDRMVDAEEPKEAVEETAKKEDEDVSDVKTVEQNKTDKVESIVIESDSADDKVNAVPEDTEVLDSSTIEDKKHDESEDIDEEILKDYVEIINEDVDSKEIETEAETDKANLITISDSDAANESTDKLDTEAINKDVCDADSAEVKMDISDVDNAESQVQDAQDKEESATESKADIPSEAAAGVVEVEKQDEAGQQVDEKGMDTFYIMD